MSENKPNINELLTAYLELDEDARAEWILNLPLEHARSVIAAAELIAEYFGAIGHVLAGIFDGALLELKQREKAFEYLAKFQDRERATRNLEQAVVNMYKTLAGMKP